MAKLQYRTILSLCLGNKSVNKIAKSQGTTPKTVRRIRDKAIEMELLPDKWRRYSEDELHRIMNPRPGAHAEETGPDWEEIHDELGRKCTSSSKNNHITLEFLYEEHCKEVKSIGLEPMCRSSFYDNYRTWCRINSFVAHTERTPGMRMEIDYAGDALLITDATTGEKSECYLFLSVLSYSKYTYMEAVEDLGKKGFLQAVINSCSYFGCTAHIWVPDCLKNAVIKGSSKEWAVLNSSMAELGKYYGVEVAPCSPYTPKGKPGVEGGVKNAYQRIYNALRNCVFYSIDDLNEAIMVELEAYNNAPFKDKPEWTRKKAFEELEKDKMLPLPSVSYEVRETATAVVGKDSYARCSIDGYYYSVPYQYKKTKVTIGVGRRDVVIYSDTGEKIATHKMGFDPFNRYVTIPEHLESFLSRYQEESPNYFITKASRAGEGTRKVIENIFETTKYPETVYKNCRSILGLGKRYGYTNLEKACTSALSKYGTSPYAYIGYTKLKPLVMRNFEMEQKAKNVGADAECDVLNMDKYEF